MNMSLRSLKTNEQLTAYYTILNFEQNHIRLFNYNYKLPQVE